jgi:amino acid permease
MSHDKAANDISRVESARAPSQVDGEVKGPQNAIDEQYGATQRGLKSRHVQLMVIGGSIGVGLWVCPLVCSHDDVASSLTV